MISLSLKNKAEVKLNTEVKEIIYNKDEKLYNIKCENENIQTDSLVLSCGSWINNVVSKNFSINLPLTINLNFLYYFQFKNEVNINLFPVYIISLEKDEEFYGFPDLNNGNGFKMGFYHQHIPHNNINEIDRKFREENYKYVFETAKKFIRNFNENSIELIKHITCLYTCTPDNDFLIDYLPNSNDKIVLVSACSGHGFKFMSAIGDHATKLLTKEEKPYDMFSLSRFIDKKF